MSEDQVKSELIEFIKNNNGCTFQHLIDHFDDFYDESGDGIILKDPNMNVTTVVWDKISDKYINDLQGMLVNQEIKCEFCEVKEYDEKKFIPEFKPIESLEEEIEINTIRWAPFKLYVIEQQ